MYLRSKSIFSIYFFLFFLALLFKRQIVLFHIRVYNFDPNPIVYSPCFWVIFMVTNDCLALPARKYTFNEHTAEREKTTFTISISIFLQFSFEKFKKKGRRNFSVHLPSLGLLLVNIPHANPISNSNGILNCVYLNYYFPFGRTEYTALFVGLKNAPFA